ncbi:DUF4870 domain-containing protein [Thermodesulfovibrionales bacterium]|nr:DUF4870 domain-containing protein [Thermodesulfovibrionales bacterium]
MMRNNRTTNTFLGISENIAGLLCYIFGFITGMVFLILEKKNEFVRFHAMQSLATFLPLFVISIVVAWIPFIGPIIAFLLTPLGLILWILLMYKAFKGERFKLPVVGDFAEKQISN